MRRAFVDLQLAPHWELMDPTRESLLSFLALTLHDDDAAARLSMAAHELMENAVKYSPDDEIFIRLDVHQDGPFGIAVENRALADHIPVVVAAIKEIKEATDLSAYYRIKIEESCTRTDGK